MKIPHSHTKCIIEPVQCGGWLFWTAGRWTTYQLYHYWLALKDWNIRHTSTWLVNEKHGQVHAFGRLEKIHPLPTAIKFSLGPTVTRAKQPTIQKKNPHTWQLNRNDGRRRSVHDIFTFLLKWSICTSRGCRWPSCGGCRSGIFVIASPNQSAFYELAVALAI